MGIGYQIGAEAAKRLVATKSTTATLAADIVKAKKALAAAKATGNYKLIAAAQKNLAMATKYAFLHAHGITPAIAKPFLVKFGAGLVKVGIVTGAWIGGSFVNYWMGS